METKGVNCSGKIVERSCLKFPEVYTLNDLENLLDRYHAGERCFNMTDCSELNHFIISYDATIEESSQLIRVFKKLTWYQAFNINFRDGKWEKF